MTLFSRLLIIFLCVHGVLHGARWPWMITPKTSLVSPQKRVIQSRKSFNKKITQERLHHLFSTVDSLCARPELVEGFPRALEDILLPQFPLCSNRGPHRKELKMGLNERKKKDESKPGSPLKQSVNGVKVRVLLDECDTESSAEWSFTADQGFAVYPINCDDRKAKKTINVAGFAVTVKHGFLYYNGKRLKYAVRLRPIGGHGEFNGVPYDGDFCIMPHKDKFLCINVVGLEDYVAAVLRTESWPGWPLEVNKVFAIACRSYGAYKVLEAKRSHRPFHVKNSNAHQTYKGRHDLPVLKMAVEQTRGIVLGFEGAPILAMFDSCCGGIIPAHIADFDFCKVPYLARTYACTHCKESSLYAWQVSYEQAAFDALLQQYKSEIARLHDIHIIKKDKAGLVTEVKLKGPKKHTVISGKKLYSMLKEVKSFHFDISKKAGKVVFNGRGFGHHIGLCQWGARQMVRDGADYRSILRFYYPGVYFMRLS